MSMKKPMYSNITASLPVELVTYINEKARGELSSKSDIIRRAILKMKEDDFWEEIRLASQDVKNGKTYKGDLDDLIKLID